MPPVVDASSSGCACTAIRVSGESMVGQYAGSWVAARRDVPPETRAALARRCAKGRRWTQRQKPGGVEMERRVVIRDAWGRDMAHCTGPASDGRCPRLEIGETVPC